MKLLKSQILGNLTFSLCAIYFICSCQGISFEDDVTLTLEQKLALQEFKAIMINRMPHDYMKEDIFLLKWLRAANFNLKDAEKNIVSNLKWREKRRMDTIHEEDWSDMKKEVKYSLQGRDKIGRSYLYFDVAGIDIRKLILQGKGDRLTRYVDKAVDEACNLVRELGEKYHNITRGHLIANMAGYNIVQQGCLRCLPFLIQMLTSVQEHYPGCADKIIVFNAPNVFEPLVNAVRSQINNELANSLQVVGTNRNVLRNLLSKDFALDQLPPAAGGTAYFAGLEED